MELTKVDEEVTGNLNSAYSGKDSNKGTFVGKLNGDKVVVTYTFNSEGKSSSREVAYQIKDNQLIEGYGDLEDNGTKFIDVNTIQCTYTTPLLKVDCSNWGTHCLFKNGQSFSKLIQTCLELST